MRTTRRKLATRESDQMGFSLAIEFANRFGLLTNPDLETLENFFGLRDAVERLVAMGPQRGKRELGWVKRLDGEARQGYPTARYT